MSYTTDKDLYRIARLNRIPLHFAGFKDQIPQHLIKGGYIVNLQSSNQGSGSHWVSFWVEPRQGVVYFDSFGEPPPLEVLEIVHKLHIPYYENNMEIQSLRSGYCGSFCLAFLSFMNAHQSIPLPQRLKAFQNLFSEHPQENLARLKALFPALVHPS